jgi:hypothetical protein
MRPGPVREFLAALSSGLASALSRVFSLFRRKPSVQSEDIEFDDDNLLIYSSDGKDDL